MKKHGVCGNLAVLEHLVAPHPVAAPVHRHTKEDEFSPILEGRVWFQADGEERIADVGDFVFKTRGEWHTSGMRPRSRLGCWN